MPASRSLLWLTLVCAAVPGCDRVTTLGPADGDVSSFGNPALGRSVFQANCAGCHATRDGFDIAFFGFTDETIRFRALAQVDSAAANDIVAYIRSLQVSPDGESRLFQPGGTVLSGDEAFSERLFGEDEWPESMTADHLLSLDPRTVSVAVAFPEWSSVQSNRHWMPETPLDEAILGHDDGAPMTALDAYYRNGSEDALIEAVTRLRWADRDVDSPQAPCVADRLEPLRCFETRRWTASLGAQFVLRAGATDRFDRSVHDSWWDLGDAARLTVLEGRPVEDALDAWVGWMYLGWTFEPGRHSSLGLADGLARAGLPRHAAFHALRAQVDRARGSALPYEDVTNVARFAPESWVFDAVQFGYLHLLDRLERDDRPEGQAENTAVYETFRSYQIAAGRISSSKERRTLRELRNKILEELD